MIFSDLFFYKILFAAEISVAEFLFTFRLKKRRMFWVRFLLCCAALAVLAAFFPTPFESPWYSFFTFFSIFALSIPILVFCYDEPVINSVFCAIAAYTLQHIAYELANLTLTLIVWGSSPLLGVYGGTSIELFAFTKVSLFYLLIYIFCYMISYAAVYFAFCKRIVKGTDLRIKSLSLLFLIGAGLLVNILLHSFIIYKKYDSVSVTVDCVYNLLCCLLLLSGQFSLLKSKELAGELDIVKRLRHEEKEQYALIKENMDIINLKCHDMRHQIREIGSGKNVPDDVIEELEKSVQLYDTAVKTGNETLDVILTEKSLRAHAEGVTLSCVADGAALNFIGDGDLYSLLGNAVDNALEAVMKIDEKEKRIISINVSRVEDFVTVCIRNSFDGNIKFDEQGMPLTSKADPNYHGYGIKSMKYIAEKYDGSLSFNVKDGMFKLNLLLPSNNE